jgi:hypothetical protein
MTVRDGDVEGLIAKNDGGDGGPSRNHASGAQPAHALARRQIVNQPALQIRINASEDRMSIRCGYVN